jgi:hypothetical protein
MKLVEFDAERFLADCDKKLAKQGAGARGRMIERCGLSAGAVAYIFKNRRVTDLEIILSMAKYFGLVTFDYIQHNKIERPKEKERVFVPPSKIYDWVLFARCTEMICWGRSSILAGLIPGMVIKQAAAILQGHGTSPKYFRKICHMLRLDPKVFLRADRRYQKETVPRVRKREAPKRRRVRTSPRLPREFDSASLG